jgi:hypothetical protein
MNSRQRRRERREREKNKKLKNAEKIEKIEMERQKDLEKEKAKAEDMEKEDNKNKKIDEIKRGGKDIVDPIVVSIPLGKLGSKSEDLRKYLHALNDKEMKATGREKIKHAIEFGERREMRERALTDNVATIISPNQIQPASDLKDSHITKSSSTASGSSSSSGTTAHKQEKKQQLDHRKEIHEIKTKPEIGQKEVTKPEIGQKEESSGPKDGGNIADKAGALNFVKKQM